MSAFNSSSSFNTASSLSTTSAPGFVSTMPATSTGLPLAQAPSFGMSSQAGIAPLPGASAQLPPVASNITLPAPILGHSHTTLASGSALPASSNFNTASSFNTSSSFHSTASTALPLTQQQQLSLQQPSSLPHHATPAMPLAATTATTTTTTALPATATSTTTTTAHHGGMMDKMKAMLPGHHATTDTTHGTTGTDAHLMKEREKESHRMAKEQEKLQKERAKEQEKANKEIAKEQKELTKEQRKAEKARLKEQEKLSKAEHKAHKHDAAYTSTMQPGYATTGATPLPGSAPTTTVLPLGGNPLLSEAQNAATTLAAKQQFATGASTQPYIAQQPISSTYTAPRTL